MPSTKFKKRNLSRYKKTYPFVQRTPRWGLVSDKDVIIEIKDLKIKVGKSNWPNNEGDLGFLSWLDLKLLKIGVVPMDPLEKFSD